MCLRLEADERPTCSQLLRHELFTGDGFAVNFSRELRVIICREYESNPLTAQTMRHRYERCRRKLQETFTDKPVHQQHVDTPSDTCQSIKVNTCNCLSVLT